LFIGFEQQRLSREQHNLRCNAVVAVVEFDYVSGVGLNVFLLCPFEHALDFLAKLEEILELTASCAQFCVFGVPGIPSYLKQLGAGNGGDKLVVWGFDSPVDGNTICLRHVNHH